MNVRDRSDLNPGGILTGHTSSVPAPDVDSQPGVNPYTKCIRSAGPTTKTDVGGTSVTEYDATQDFPNAGGPPPPIPPDGTKRGKLNKLPLGGDGIEEITKSQIATIPVTLVIGRQGYSQNALRPSNRGQLSMAETQDRKRHPERYAPVVDAAVDSAAQPRGAHFVKTGDAIANPGFGSGRLGSV